MQISIPLPQNFNFDHSLQSLRRSDKEPLHKVVGDRVIKFLHNGRDPILFSIRAENGALHIEFLLEKPEKKVAEDIREYVREWLDLDTDLKPFYTLARKDELLKGLVKEYAGYRIVGIPDLFESLVWAVMGQQINVQFAYTIKQRFVEKFGSNIMFENQSYYAFPTPGLTARLSDADLLPMQFSRQKSKYVRLIAEAFVTGEISKEKLSNLSLTEAKEKLMKIKGVGNWTANYALMKTFRRPDAFPLEDVALHKAIQLRRGMKKKPSIELVKRIFKNYKGWEAYATLYLWRSL